MQAARLGPLVKASGAHILAAADMRTHAQPSNPNPPRHAPHNLSAGDRLRDVVEGVVEGTLRLSVDKWWPGGAAAAASGGPPQGFEKVYARMDPRAQGSTMSFK